MQALKATLPAALTFALALTWSFARPSAHHEPSNPQNGWYRSWYGQPPGAAGTVRARGQSLPGARPPARAMQFPGPGEAADFREGRRLFERETFGGNGRTCLTCHSHDTGTVSPEDAQQRFQSHPDDPLFVHDGSDDEDGDGFGDNQHATRILADATILMRIPLHGNVTLRDDPTAKFVTVRRGIPTTLNTPALDPVLMLDGRQPDLVAQALGAITDHAQGTADAGQRALIAGFQLSNRFFTSPALEAFARGGAAPTLPPGHTPSEKRGRTFFEDLPPDFSVTPPNFKPGLCASCHSGPMLNQTNQFLPLAVPPGTRFQTVLVSEFNAAGNPTIDFVFSNQEHDSFDGNPDGIIHVSSPDPGRALISGRADDLFPFPPGSFDHLNAFKIAPLRGIRRTAPYFHDNSARTLEDLALHYREFFLIVSAGPDGPGVVLSDQDLADIVAYLRLLD